MSAVGLAGPVADPEHVRRAVVPLAGGGIDPGQRLLIFQDQGFVRGIELGLPNLRRRRPRQAAGRHEIEGLAKLIGQRLVARPLRALGDEAEIPAVHRVEIGVAALGQGAQQVEGRRRLAVGLDQPLRVRRPRAFVEGHPVDHVAAIGRQCHRAHGLGIGRARLGELARQPADLDHRELGAIGQHDRHLEKDAEGVPNGIRVELREALGAIATLQEEPPALACLSEALAQAPRLAGEDQRRHPPEARLGRGERRLVGPGRLLLDRQRAPAAGAPGAGHVVLPQAFSLVEPCYTPELLTVPELF